MRKFVLCCALLLSMVGCSSKKPMQWEIVIHARKGQLEQTRLVLDDVGQYVSAFTVGKPREVVFAPLQAIVGEWDNLFRSSNPNATLSIRTAQNEQKVQVVILKKPQLSDHQLIFRIEQISGSLEGEFIEAMLFVDPTACCYQVSNCGGWPTGCHHFSY